MRIRNTTVGNTLCSPDQLAATFYKNTKKLLQKSGVEKIPSKNFFLETRSIISDTHKSLLPNRAVFNS